MTKRTRTAVLALAALAALALAAVATAAYTSPKLQVTYGAGNVTRVIASSAANDDSTARAAIVIPNGTSITTTAAPGTKVGTAQAQVSALALGGALLPLLGDIIVAPPGAVAPATQAQCTLGATPQLTLLLVLQAAGQTINLPAYVIPTSAAQQALGSAQLVFCLPPPDIPVGAGRRDVRREVPERRPHAERRVRLRRAGRVGRVLDAVAGGQRPDQPGGHRRLAGGDRAGRPDA